MNILSNGGFSKIAFLNKKRYGTDVVYIWADDDLKILTNNQ